MLVASKITQIIKIASMFVLIKCLKIMKPTKHGRVTVAKTKEKKIIAL